MLVTLVGCAQGDSEARRAAALEAARQYLAAVADPSGDRGWELIDEVMDWTGFEAYRARIEDADPDIPSVTATEVLRCKDGSACEVCLVVETPEAVPDVLRSSDDRAFDGIILLPDPMGCGNALMGVGLDRLTGDVRGVWIGPK